MSRRVLAAAFTAVRVSLVLLRRGEGVEVALQVALRLRVELCLEGRQLLRDAQEAAHFHAQDHPDHI